MTRALLLCCTALPAFAQDLSPETQLAPIVVEGDPGVVTEGVDSYSWQRVTVGGKQPTETRDIPQTVTVLSRQALDDAGASSIEEASRLLPNLTVATGDGFIGSLYTRGQEVFQYYVDGAPRPFLSLYGTAPDLFFFDRVEVMSGPSGVFQGSGEPVGTLNLVRKRPTTEFQGEAGVSLDHRGSYRLQADLGGALNEAGTVRGRLAAYGAHQEGFTDETKRDAKGLYGTLEIDLGEATTLSAGGIYEKIDTLRFSGFPTYEDGGLVTDDVKRSDFIGSTDNEADIERWEAFLELEHEFDYGGVLKATARHYENSADLRNLLGNSSVARDTGDFELMWFARDYDQTAQYADLNLTSPLALGGMATELVVGADFRKVTSSFNQNFDFSAGMANLFDFDPSAYPLPDIQFPGVGPGFRLNTESTVEELGLYAQARVEITDRFKLNLGGRYSVYEATSEDLGRGLSQSSDETNFAPYLGVTYDITDQVTGYASYAEIFQPQTETDVSGNVLKPRQGRQGEVGLKYVSADGRITAQGAYFHIFDKNRAEAVSANPGAFRATGEETTQGVELLLSGELRPQFEVIAGYSYVDTTLESDPTSPQNLTLYGKYRFEQGAWDGLSLGGGVRAASKFDAVDNRSGLEIEAPGYAVVDAFAAYALANGSEIRLNIYNLFDTNYVERINTETRGTYFGRPITASLSYTHRF